jgi:glutaredoxin
MKVEIYSKADCGLCDEAKAALLRVQKRVPFELTEVDIQARPELYERYRYDIPVIWVNGRMVCRHRVDEKAFEARLKQESP